MEMGERERERERESGGGRERERASTLTLLGINKRESPFITAPDSNLPITSVPMS